MAPYMHMGHDTENLVGEKDLEDFSGLILSPVNRSPHDLEAKIDNFRQKGTFSILFDSQLYFPQSQRGYLQDYEYFPSDLDTAEIGNIGWWESTTSKLFEFATNLAIDEIASPVVYPKQFTQEYYFAMAEVAQVAAQIGKQASLRTLSTILAPLDHLEDDKEILKISSIASESDTSGYYLIFVSNLEPRREYKDANSLTGAMKLIHYLKSTGKPVLVSHCSSEMPLFRAAGASSCATGKFFNLRRFTPGRFDEPQKGGGQLPYWFEQGLMAFIREADIRRLQAENFTSILETGHSKNYWSAQILDQFSNNPKKAWVALGWRQFLSWFSHSHENLSQDPISTLGTWLKVAEENWLELEDNAVFMEEPRNDGQWIRPWRIALSQFSKFLQNS